MTVSPLRTLALAAAALLVLGGCAVPGKGQPGVLAEYRGTVITDDDISSLREGMSELYSAPDSGEDVTLLLLGPEVVSIAEDLGYAPTEQQLLDRAAIWTAFTNEDRFNEVPLTSGGLEVVRVVDSISLLMHDPDGTLALIALVKDLEANAIVSPRYGDFTLEYFTTSIDTISQNITDNSLALGPAEFLVWKDINGFSISAQPDWISSE